MESPNGMVAVPDASVAPAACNSSSPLLSAASSLQVEIYILGCANEKDFAATSTNLDWLTNAIFLPQDILFVARAMIIFGGAYYSTRSLLTRRARDIVICPSHLSVCRAFRPPSLLRLQQVTLRWNSSCRFWAKSSGVRCRLQAGSFALSFLQN